MRATALTRSTRVTLDKESGKSKLTEARHVQITKESTRIFKCTVIIHTKIV